MVVPQMTDRNVEHVEVVDFDYLFTKDPRFFKSKIRKYHVLEGTRYHINYATYNLVLHETDEEIVIPEFLRKLSHSPQEREKEMEGLTSFLVVLGSIDREDQDVIEQFIRHVYGGRRLPDGRTNYLDTYLDHLA